MKHVVFALCVGLILAGLAAAIWVEAQLYAPPRAGAALPAVLADATSFQIQLLLDDAKQTVQLSLPLLAAAGYLLLSTVGRTRRRDWPLHAVAFTINIVISFGSIFCAAMVNSALLDMLVMGVFDIRHPWLIGPAKAQYVLLLANGFVLAVWAMYSFTYGDRAEKANAAE